MKSTTSNPGNGRPVWTDRARRPVNVGCEPMRPVDFQRMTPKQRRELAERRRREVAAAQAFHVTPEYHADVDPEIIQCFLAALAPLMDEARTDQACACGRPTHARGMCWMHYDRWRVAMKLAREAA